MNKNGSRTSAITSNEGSKTARGSGACWFALLVMNCHWPHHESTTWRGRLKAAEGHVTILTQPRSILLPNEVFQDNADGNVELQHGEHAGEMKKSCAHISTTQTHKSLSSAHVNMTDGKIYV